MKILGKKELSIAFLLIFALAAATLYAAGKEEGVTAAKTGPQYGGKATIFAGQNFGDPPQPDVAGGFLWGARYLEPIRESPYVGDTVKYGPRGTGEFAFQSGNYIPAKFLVGQILESWEINTEKATWHVRPGIYWSPNEDQLARGVMKSREVTAEDVAADLNYYKNSELFKATFMKAGAEWAGEAYAADKYTVIIPFPHFNSLWAYRFGYEDRSGVSPRETQGNTEWKDMVGTGPFMYKEYVVGSHFAYQRNPKYWNTTIIDGKEYKLPFIDELVLPIIPDQFTQLAALQTGKLDFHINVPATQWETIDKQSPGIQKATYSVNSNMVRLIPIGQGTPISPILKNKDVRRALQIGTDIEAFMVANNAKSLNKYCWPAHYANPIVYIPPEKLPENVRVLFNYNPTLAKKMLADAGYPNGFKLEYACESDPTNLDIAAMLKDQWAKIGVDLQIVASDQVTFHDRLPTFQQAFHQGIQMTSPTVILLTDEPDINSYWSTPRHQELRKLISAEFDESKQVPFIKEANMILAENVPLLTLYPMPSGHYWWPWLKNYYGEVSLTDGDPCKLFGFIWIDQDLKAKMGF